jgi:hypothetical protein
MKTTKSHQSEAARSYYALQATVDQIRALQREVTRDVVALEQSGARPEAPTSDEYSGPDTELINGASYQALPPANEANIQLFHKLRRSDQLKLTLSEVEKQLFAATMDLSRELLLEFDPEIRELHRERALLIVQLFRCNRDLETLREKILQRGGVIGHGLDGWSERFFGTSTPATPLNSWPLKYLAECSRLGIINERDIDANE